MSYSGLTTENTKPNQIVVAVRDSLKKSLEAFIAVHSGTKVGPDNLSMIVTCTTLLALIERMENKEGEKGG